MLVPLASLVLALVTTASAAAAEGKFNVLFLVSDDMRPELGAYYGPDFPTPIHPNMHTPNLDNLASRSLLLKRAYVQQAVCSPSRTSLLTGRRPDTTHVTDLYHYFRNVAGNFTTIPQYFKEHGYLTAGMGKIFHPGPASGYDDPISWTEPFYHGKLYWEDKYKEPWKAVSEADYKKYPLEDQQTTVKALETLKQVALKALSGEQNFFVALGFKRPHLPFIFPEEFLKYYPEKDIRLPKNPYAPVGMPEIAWSDFDELRTYAGIGTKYGYGGINTTLPDNIVLELRRAYYSAISYVDSLIGDVVKTLDELGLSNSTIISFWGDHGWQLGEHGEWSKMTNFEITTHVPLIVHVPGITDKGVVTEELVEFVDLFPTLAEASGLPPIPQCPKDSSKVDTCTEGLSFMPLMRYPTKPWKSAAFSQYPRKNMAGDDVMGYTMRTDRYRYTEWKPYDVYAHRPYNYSDTELLYEYRVLKELYDHANDPEENVNVANDPQYEKIQQQLHDELEKGWRGALPKQ